MLAAAALLVLVGSVSKSWFTIERGLGGAELHLGLTGAEVCSGGACVDTPTDRLPGDVSFVSMVGMLTGIASAILAGWLGGALLAGKRDKLPPARIARITFRVATSAFIYFVVRGFNESGVSPGWSMFVSIGGIVMATFGLRSVVTALGPAYGSPPPRAPGMAPPAGFAPSAPPPGFVPSAAPPAGFVPGAAPAGPAPMGYAPTMAAGSGYANAPAPSAPPPVAAPVAAPACPRCGQPLQFVAQYQRWFCAREQQYV